MGVQVVEISDNYYQIHRWKKVVKNNRNYVSHQFHVGKNETETSLVLNIIPPVFELYVLFHHRKDSKWSLFQKMLQS